MTLQIYTFGLGVDAFHTAVHFQVDASLVVQLKQAWDIVRYIVECFLRAEIVELHTVARAFLACHMLGEHAYLLGCTATLMLGVGVGKDASSAFGGKLLHRLPVPLSALEVVDAVGVTLPQSLT